MLYDRAGREVTAQDRNLRLPLVDRPLQRGEDIEEGHGPVLFIGPQVATACTGGHHHHIGVHLSNVLDLNATVHVDCDAEFFHLAGQPIHEHPVLGQGVPQVVELAAQPAGYLAERHVMTLEAEETGGVHPRYPTPDHQHPQPDRRRTPGGP